MQVFIKQSMLRVFVLHLLPVVAFCSSPISDDYDHSVYMDESEKFQLHWSIKEDKYAHFALQVKTTGWVGFGIANGLSGNMKGADLVIGYVVNGKGYLTDRYGEGQWLPKLDKQQDYTLVEATESNGETVIKFSRRLETCDQMDLPISDGTMRLLYAFNDRDPSPGEAAESFSKHSTKGSRSMNLKAYVTNKRSKDSSTLYWDVFQPNVPVPKGSTTYWCSVHQTPDFKGKVHVVEIEPIIEKGHETLVHHILIYSCRLDFDEQFLNASNNCYDPRLPEEVLSCAGKSTVFAWAIGGGNFPFPSHVGVPLGTIDTAKFYVLEVHYDNPLRKAGILDSSGLRLRYTSNLRQFDAATLMTGVTVNEAMIIPPGQNDWLTHGYCHPQCSAKIQSNSAINGNEIRLFGSTSHAHLTGKAIWTSLIRNGKEIAKIASDENYDFNFQQTLLLRNEVTMKAGDALLTTCKYDSKDRSFATVGGLSTREEMCLDFIMYYPRQNLTMCTSQETMIQSTFRKKYEPSGKYGGWSTVPWNDTMLTEYKRYLGNDTAFSGCIGHVSIKHDGIHGQALQKPMLTVPLKASQSDCSESTASQSNTMKPNVVGTALFIAITISINVAVYI